MLMPKTIDVPHRGYTERIFAEARAGSATVRIVDNLLDGSEIRGCEGSPLLRWRMAPQQIGAAGQLGERAEFVPFGKIMFFPAGIPYQTRRFKHSEQNRNIICVFDSNLKEMLGELDGLWDRPTLLRCLDINCGRIDLAVQRIAHEVTHPGFASTMLLDNLLSSLAIDLVRYFRAGEAVGAIDPGRGRALSDVHLRRITDFIVGAREGCPTSAQLAELCGMTPSSFRQRFKATTGQSLHAYVEQVRLSRAKAFLVNTEMSMKEIAYELGFTHQATFTSSFRRATGTAPSDYRKAHWH